MLTNSFRAGSTASLALLLTGFLAGTAHGQVRFWEDPVVTYTNGMRLASTTSQRSHNVYWRCDPGHKGYCDGRMYSEFRNDVRSIGTRTPGWFCFYAGPRPGPTASHTAHRPEGIETDGFERLGTVQAPGPALAGAAAVAATRLNAAPHAQTQAQASDGAGNWFTDLQRLGEKMSLSAGPDAEAE